MKSARLRELIAEHRANPPLREPHADYCEHCPSAPHQPSDPETDDIMAEIAAGHATPDEWVFPCAWRREKLCKGICERLGYQQEPKPC